MNPNREPERGDLIEISRKGYQHWAIYVGDGYVLHLVKISEHGDSGTSCAKPGKDGRATVKKEKLEDVANNDEYRINNRLDNQYEPRPIKDILQDAENLVGREFPYNVLSSNCEHFATLVRYGNPLSQQVQDLAASAVVFGILAMATYRKK
ncbi:retinoic acid receptor responder protein 3-like [Sinocyclocheilus grahami]|uniref:retinoic acid receptor responder protein 3-like n=1 Tax=Sinocyclocheilus grahami TaxID=75366 RepID=UPI0007ACC02F|nr:PREDICTED: retinoic acid receptor responder protein 3-like [Sinocyclocheilus grahami]